MQHFMLIKMIFEQKFLVADFALIVPFTITSILLAIVSIFIMFHLMQLHIVLLCEPFEAYFALVSFLSRVSQFMFRQVVFEGELTIALVALVSFEPRVRNHMPPKTDRRGVSLLTHVALVGGSRLRMGQHMLGSSTIVRELLRANRTLEVFDPRMGQHMLDKVWFEGETACTQLTLVWFDVRVSL